MSIVIFIVISLSLIEFDFDIQYYSKLACVASNQVNALYLVRSELDLNRLDGDSVCPPMRSGQDDLPGNAKWEKPKNVVHEQATPNPLQGNGGAPNGSWHN